MFPVGHCRLSETHNKIFISLKFPYLFPCYVKIVYKPYKERWRLSGESGRFLIDNEYLIVTPSAESLSGHVSKL